MLAAVIVLGLGVIGLSPQRAVADSGVREGERPFILPFSGDPGPDNWLFIQPYGNTKKFKK